MKWIVDLFDINVNVKVESYKNIIKAMRNLLNYLLEYEMWHYS